MLGYHAKDELYKLKERLVEVDGHEVAGRGNEAYAFGAVKHDLHGFAEAFFRLNHHLTARPAGGNGTGGKSSGRVACRTAKHNHSLVRIPAVGIEKCRPFSAETGGIGAVLLVGTCDDGSVFQ